MLWLVLISVTRGVSCRLIQLTRKLLSPGYVPTAQDILTVQWHTVGTAVTIITVNDTVLTYVRCVLLRICLSRAVCTHVLFNAVLGISFLDVGGLRSERKKWMTMVKSAPRARIIFVVALDSYVVAVPNSMPPQFPRC